MPARPSPAQSFRSTAAGRRSNGIHSVDGLRNRGDDMTTKTKRSAKTRGRTPNANGHAAATGNGAPKPKWQKGFPGQVVLVLQGGGALGAYQVGVYEAMHEAGVEPDWVIGTSIGAINAALIAGNAPDQRFERLTEFWSRLESVGPEIDLLRFFTGLANASANLTTVMRGIPAF